uniref:Uncharacterized protein n=1 Tax=Anguilla anguilla TaxID=7936 RepID=A0A0E9W0Q8_ANGAN
MSLACELWGIAHAPASCKWKMQLLIMRFSKHSQTITVQIHILQMQLFCHQTMYK